MPTKLKSDTARANGSKSQGQKTAEGRAKSSRNAVKHGLSSRNPLVLECENDDDFQAVHDNQMEIHQPATPAEKDLVDQMAAASMTYTSPPVHRKRPPRRRDAQNEGD